MFFFENIDTNILDIGETRYNFRKQYLSD